MDTLTLEKLHLSLEDKILKIFLLCYDEVLNTLLYSSDVLLCLHKFLSSLIWDEVKCLCLSW